MQSDSNRCRGAIGRGGACHGRVRTAALLVTPWLIGFVLVNPAARPVQEGNEAYRAGDYDKALARYRSVQDAGADEAIIHFNAGDALYRQDRYKEAVEEYQRALGGDLDAATHYNIGNCEFRMGRLDQAIASYRRTLELDPRDQAAKHNLELAMQLLKQAQSQQKKKQGKQGAKQGEKQRGSQDERKGSEKQQAGRKEQPKQAGQQQTGGEPPSAKRGTQQGSASPARMVPMSRQEAIKLLEALAAQDREAQKRIVRVPVKPSRLPSPDKDW